MDDQLGRQRKESLAKSEKNLQRLEARIRPTNGVRWTTSLEESPKIGRDPLRTSRFSVILIDRLRSPSSSRCSAVQEFACFPLLCLREKIKISAFIVHCHLRYSLHINKSFCYSPLCILYIEEFSSRTRRNIWTANRAESRKKLCLEEKDSSIVPP